MSLINIEETISHSKAGDNWFDHIRYSLKNNNYNLIPSSVEKCGKSRINNIKNNHYFEKSFPLSLSHSLSFSHSVSISQFSHLLNQKKFLENPIKEIY